MVAAKIKIEHLFQVYGKHPAAACSMLAAGKSRPRDLSNHRDDGSSGRRIPRHL